MKALEIFIALSLFNLLLYYFLKNRKEAREYKEWLRAQEEEDKGDPK